MINNVIGVFDSVSVAEDVVKDLSNSGFSKDAVTRYDGSSNDLEKQLQDSGVEQGDAREYAGSVSKDGAIVVAQADDDQTEEAVAIMNRYYTDSSSNDAQYASEGDTRTGGTIRDASDDQRLEVVEEQLQVGKRTVERGGVRVKRVVSEREVEAQVTLRDETIHVDRQKVDRAPSSADDLFTEKTVEFTETDEEAVVAKEARVVEEVVVGKDVEQRTETVRDTVRRADVEVEELGTRYGESLASDPQYKDQEWQQVESKARSDWERDNKGKSSWEEAQGSIKNAWDKMRGKR